MKQQLSNLFVLFCYFFVGMAYSQQDDVAIAKNYFENNIEKYKLAKRDINEMVVSSAYVSPTTGWYHIYFNQTFQDIEVFKGMLNIAMKDNSVIHVGNSFVENLVSKMPNSLNSKLISPQEALHKAAASQNLITSALEDVKTLSIEKLVSGSTNKTTFFDSKLSNENIEVKLYWFPGEKIDDKKEQDIKLVWSVRFLTKDYKNGWNIHVDAGSGEIVQTYDEVIHCDFGTPHGHLHDEVLHRLDTEHSNFALTDSSYAVFDIPLESPNHGSRTVVEKPYTRFVPMSTGPGGTNGWHNDGSADYTTTRGNNVWAQEDNNGNNGTGASPVSSTLEFDYPYTQATGTALANQNAAITNLFYWNNLIHDVLYKYGFDEPSGNFQKDNMGRGGLGNDFVFADAQDGSGTNNANFYTPADGSNGRMQMYLFSNVNGYQPDSDFDNGIIIHEYGHGWSIRLTGGPANSACLQNGEQGGEGWSDYLGLMLTTNWASLTPTLANANISRGVGTYVSGQATTGNGIRPYPYSYDMTTVNSAVTYGKIGDPTFRSPHGIGSIWATMLWDMTWEIILQDNQITSNIYNTPGNVASMTGNVAALKLVNEGLRLQPCSPSFIQARDAILSADQALFNGRYHCAISRAFARRGLGIHASTGLSTNDRNVTEDFTPFSEPSLSSVIVHNLCSNTAFSYTATSATAGVAFNWTRPAVPGISNAASSGNSATVNETLVNTTDSPVTVTYYFTLTPTSACSGVQLVRVVINPASTAPYSICQNENLAPGEGLMVLSKTNSVRETIAAGSTYTRGQGDNITYYSTSSVGSAVYYKAVTFIAPSDGPTIFEVLSANLTGIYSEDTYLTLYHTSFNPANPAVNFLRGDDDNGDNGRSRLIHTLEQGRAYVLVVSTYYNGVTGTFTLSSNRSGFLNDNYQWYKESTGGAVLGTGFVFNPVGVAGSGISTTSSAGTTTFYAAHPDFQECRIPAVFTVKATSLEFPGAPSAICAGETLSLLGISSNGVTGTWSPALNNQATTTYTFTPTVEQCLSTPATLTIAVNPKPETPVITANGPLTFCEGGSVTLSSNTGNNNALTFSQAASQYVTVPHSPSINLGATFTMEAWVNYSAMNSTIVDKGDYNFLWQLNATGHLNGSANLMGFYQKNPHKWYYTDRPVPPNTWSHVAVTFDNGTLTFYINGVNAGTHSGVSHPEDNLPMNIGRQQLTHCQCNHFNGTMDELRIWNIVRSPAEIQANMNSTVPANSTGLSAYYKFDEGTGTTTADATPNNNHGTLINGPVWQTPSSYPLNTAVVWTPGNIHATNLTATSSGSYTATVTNGYGCTGLASVNVNVNSNATQVTLTSPADDYSSVNILKTASSVNGKIKATNKVTGISRVTYNAKSIELNDGFRADNGTVFLAETGGCGN